MRAPREPDAILKGGTGGEAGLTGGYLFAHRGCRFGAEGCVYAREAVRGADRSATEPVSWQLRVIVRFHLERRIL